MKTILSLLLIGLGLALADQTNITIKITVERIVGSTTNSSNTTLTLDGSTKKDTLLTDGAVWAYNNARAAGYTNSMELWLKQDARDRLGEYSKAKLAQDYLVLTSQLTYLLANPDLLSTADINNLKAIGAKAP